VRARDETKNVGVRMCSTTDQEVEERSNVGFCRAAFLPPRFQNLRVLLRTFSTLATRLAQLLSYNLCGLSSYYAVVKANHGIAAIASMLIWAAVCNCQSLAHFPVDIDLHLTRLLIFFVSSPC